MALRVKTNYDVAILLERYHKNQLNYAVYGSIKAIGWLGDVSREKTFDIKFYEIICKLSANYSMHCAHALALELDIGKTSLKRKNADICLAATGISRKAV